MPIFNINNALKTSTLSVPFGDENTLDFMTGKDKDIYISAKEALMNSDIYSTIFQISGDLASSQIISDMTRYQGIIDNPSVTSNKHAFWQAVFAQLLLGGEAFIYRWRNVNGIDNHWEYLRPSQVSAYLLDDGSGLIYNITFDEPKIGVKMNVPQNDVLHFRLLSKNGGMTGISPLSALSNELNIKNDSNKLTRAALSQSIMAPGILKITKEGKVNWKIKAMRAKEFMRQTQVANNGPVVIDDLEEYSPLEIKSDIAKLLAQADWTGNQIAKVYGIPNSYLNGQGDQQSSLDQIKGMYANALSRYMESIVSELNNKLSTTIHYNIRPAIDPLQDSYAQVLSGLTKDGMLAHNQARYLLQGTGYLPDDLPEPQSALLNPPKGGDANGKDTD
ncbi:phage portal protein [Ligilactobacillus salivarius]|uniref:phage portal protein n=1 Tax=Ligilactobacillus salivarius TaxID=1624 RepID=UPI001371185F|nr:phage portal protein [Ligilactobacillus salivarius]MYU49811.1 phage portal protein [Ligilactobacillus salivarius]MYU95025.1 phage portal protein [Ligilactobacillus salivarius]MYV15164.1 phage portal protein [Ligilactobacillus salivarius]MYY75937.1 phage portal protein [Ligilactobacillus salivarius]